MATVSMDGVNIYYEVHGNGFPMILAHGLGGNAGEWRFQTSVFSDRYQIILWDMRGQGQSDCPIDPNLYGQDVCANDLLGILDHLQISQACVGGTSLGGGVATNFALAHPGGFHSRVQLGKRCLLTFSAPTCVFGQRFRSNSTS